MRVWLIVLILTALCPSCGLLKNTKSNVEQVHQESDYKAESQLVDYKDWLRTTESLSLYSDSSLQTYAVRLWPRGSFTLSADQGFSGEADSVIILGSLKEGAGSALTLNTIEQDKGKIEFKAKTAVQQAMSQKSKLKEQETSWIWIAGILALVYLLSCMVLYKK